MDSNSFWQSSLWWKIISESHHAKEVWYVSDDGTILSFEDWQSYPKQKFLIEVRAIGIRQLAGFILGTTVVPSRQVIESACQFLSWRWCIFLQIEPLFGEISDWEKSQYRHFLTQYTRTIDLSQSLDMILHSMASKWRYNIRLAERNGVVVKRVETTEENLWTFLSLLEETVKRDHFHHNGNEYYRTFVKTLSETSSWWLYFAYFEDRVIASSILVLSSERALYYYGASWNDTRARKVKGPEILQWAMIKDAKEYWAIIYDFLGVADPENPRDPLLGVSQFKDKFWWRIVRLPEKKIFPLSWKYYWFIIVYKVRKYIKQRFL